MSSIQALNTPEFPEWVADKFDATLNPIGKLNLLAVAVRIAPGTEALKFVDAFMAHQATGNPPPSFLSVMDDAQWHASMSTPQEIKAYCLAYFKAMPISQQTAFLSFVTLKPRVNS